MRVLLQVLLLRSQISKFNMIVVPLDIVRFSSYSNGFYTVRGQGYLDGECNESLLIANTTCQLFLEDQDEWVDAVIVGRKEISIPHTDLTMKLFTVDFKSTLSGNIGGWKREDDIKSDRLRLLATSEGKPTDLNGTLLGVAATQSENTGESFQQIKLPKPEIQKSTGYTYDDSYYNNQLQVIYSGISAWQTLSVEIVDEEVQMLERERLKLLEKEKLKEEKLLKEVRF